MSISRITEIPYPTKSHEIAENASLLESVEKTKGARRSTRNDPLISQIKQDEFVKSEKQEPVTYEKPKVSALDELRAQADTQIEAFKKLIRSLLTEQGEEYNLVLFGQKLNVTPEESAKAKEAISEGGEYSVDAVAGRIVDMAKALSGGDKSKLGTLKDAVLKGFDEAKKVWGGEMPQITQDTYDEVMRRFDEWENEGQTE